MNTSASVADERATGVTITEDELTVRLADGRAISTPLVWYPRLLNATPEQRANWELIGSGRGIHWEDVDEDLSIEGMLRGIPAVRPSLAAHTAVNKGQQESTAVSMQQVIEEDDGHQKGLLDHFVDLEEASDELVLILADITGQIEDIASKVTNRTNYINSINEGGAEVKLSDVNTIYLAMAAEINGFSKEVEKKIPQFKKVTSTLEASYTVYISAVQSAGEQESAERLRSLRTTLNSLLGSVGGSKESMIGFKDRVQTIRDQNINIAMNKATAKQVAVLNDLVTSIEEFESFALRMVFMIGE